MQQPVYNLSLMIKVLKQQIPNDFKLLRRKNKRITSNFQQPETHLNQIGTRNHGASLFVPHFLNNFSLSCKYILILHILQQTNCVTAA